MPITRMSLTSISLQAVVSRKKELWTSRNISSLRIHYLESIFLFLVTFSNHIEDRANSHASALNGNTSRVNTVSLRRFRFEKPSPMSSIGLCIHPVTSEDMSYSHSGVDQSSASLMYYPPSSRCYFISFTPSQSSRLAATHNELSGPSSLFARSLDG
jgi:hypothetical protein